MLLRIKRYQYHMDKKGNKKPQTSRFCKFEKNPLRQKSLRRFTHLDLTSSVIYHNWFILSEESLFPKWKRKLVFTSFHITCKICHKSFYSLLIMKKKKLGHLKPREYQKMLRKKQSTSSYATPGIIKRFWVHRSQLNQCAISWESTPQANLFWCLPNNKSFFHKRKTIGSFFNSRMIKIMFRPSQTHHKSSKRICSQMTKK